MSVRCSSNKCMSDRCMSGNCMCDKCLNHNCMTDCMSDYCMSINTRPWLGKAGIPRDPSLPAVVCVEWLTKLRRWGRIDQLQTHSGQVAVRQASAEVHIRWLYGTDVTSALQTGECLFCLIICKPFVLLQPAQGLSS